MGSVSPLRDKAVALRLEGKSYGQILKLLNISSKGTLSGWFKHLVLPPASRKKLERNIKLATERGLFAFNARRSRQIEDENTHNIAEGEKLVGSLTERELLLVGAALYWGEGTKSVSYPTLVFTNSDPLMVKAYMCFLRKVFGVSESRIRAGIHLYSTTDQKAARLFWAKTIQIPPERFYIVMQVSRASMGRRKFNTLPFGTVVIKTCNRPLFYRMKGMIKGIAKATEFLE